jgi:DNA modification methylase
MALTTEKILKNLIDVSQIKYDRRYSKLAKMHKYWSRKPWFILKEYIDKYSNAGDVVLDPFCGSGSVGLEAVLLNRNFIGYDLNPFAVLLANNELNLEFNSDSFSLEFKKLENSLKNKIMNLYKYNDSYILYTIVGHKNEKDYNAVISNYDFYHKDKISLESKYINPKVVFPKGLEYPDQDFPTKFYKDRFSYKGVKKVSDMFSKRNLLALALIFNEIERSKLKNKDLFILAFTNTLLHVSKLKAESVRPLGVNNYWIPDDHIEENVWWRFSDRVENMKKGKTAIIERVKKGESKNKYKIINKSSLKMASVKNNSVDYVFTDPPYGEAIQYSELSYIWNTWLSKKFQIKDEVIINPVQEKGINQFNEQIARFLTETKRVLREDGYFTLCFQNKDPEIWIDLVKKIYKRDFILIDISSFDTFGNPYNKNWAKFSPKSDFYVTFQKTTKKNISLNKKKSISSGEIAEEIIKYLSKEKNKKIAFNLNKGYDLFVGVVINKIFSGYEIFDTEKLTVENIIHTLEKTVK